MLHAVRPSSRTAVSSSPRLLLAIVALLVVVAASRPAVASVDAPLSTVEEASWFGGTCGSSCDGGSSGSGSSSDDTEPSRVGTAYWVTTSQVLSSYDPGVSEIVHRYHNWDDRELRHRFEVERRVSRSVDFSGGYADYFRLSIGGEVDRTTKQTTEKVLDPYEGLKVYRRQETRRYTVSGARYQDYDDGSRRVVARASGPYTTSVSVVGYVTFPLR
jgi:hypothetical protein